MSTQSSTKEDSPTRLKEKSTPGTTNTSSYEDAGHFGNEPYENPTGINENALVRKLDIKLLPPLTLLYLLSFLDRSNIGNAKIEGLATDLHITGNMYLLTLTIYFVGYVLFEVPSNVVLKKTTPRFWLPSLMIAWGIVATLLGVCTNFSGFVVARFFLGVTESGLFPGVVYYLSMWYKRNEQQYRVALFFSAASLAGAFGGILAWAIAHMDGVGGLAGWRWIFILEGLLTVVAAVISYFLIHNYPATASFLSEPERDLIHARLKSDSDATRTENFDWHNVIAAFKDYKCYLYGLAYHTIALPLYTLSLFLPTIISSLGYSSAQAQLLTVPPYAVATILTVIVSILSEKTKKRSPYIIATSSLAVIGYIILLAAPEASSSPKSKKSAGLSYAGTFLAAAGIYPSAGLVLSWPGTNVSGQTKRATACALMISIAILAAVLGTQLYRPATSPTYRLGHGFALGYMIANIGVVSTIWYCLSRENRKRLAGERDDRLVQVREGKFLGDEDPRYIFQW